MNVNSVLKEELRKISLSKERVDGLFGIAQEIIDEMKEGGIKAEIGGSLAKGTLIRKKVQDIDIFVSFENEEEISKLADFLDKSNFEIKRIHGSRDYFHILRGDLIVELIPVVAFSDPALAKNVTDFSLLHVNYIKKKLKQNKKIADEIKLAKNFCHAQKCYGAESYIRGFSGYALELLVIHFGSFAKMLTGLSKAKTQLLIDPEKKFKKNEAFRELNESKLISPVILIDPTYKLRNATAGLSEETFGKFANAAKKFLKKPSVKFFEETEFDVGKFEKIAKKNKAGLFKINLSTKKQEGDIAATKMKKFFDFMIAEFKKREQKVIVNEFLYDEGQKATGYFVVKEKNILELKGPPLKLELACEAFKQKHKKTFNRKGFIWTKASINTDEIFEKLKKSEKEMDVKFKVVKIV